MNESAYHITDGPGLNCQLWHVRQGSGARLIATFLEHDHAEYCCLALNNHVAGSAMEDAGRRLALQQEQRFMEAFLRDDGNASDPTPKAVCRRVSD